MMEPEYFDNDELINDYMEEPFDEPPPDEEFPDDFIMEEHLAQPTQATIAQPSPVLQPVLQPVPVVRAQETQESVPVATIDLQSAASRKERNLYSFERFNNNDNWRRSKKDEEDSFAVKEWKRTKVTSPTARATSKKESSSAGPLLTSTGIFKKLPQVNLDMHDKKSHSVRRMPLEGRTSVTMTVSGGNRVHVATNEADENGKELPSPQSLKKKKKPHLLGHSIHTLMARSDTIMMQQSQQEKQRKSSQSVLSSGNGDNQLWVDKHAPTTFSHLLSDEQTNRNVLRALRAWDPYVFHKEAPKARFTKRQEENNEMQKTPTPTNPRDLRPDETHRVLLLSGPPGVGKTTLAHIVARHAGYQPMEVNASDDRSAAVLQEKVIRAMESSTLTNDLKLGGKPNCIILDEVDGADAKSAVASLVKIIRAEMPEKNNGKKSATFLRRPIIFICNHKYAPALRPLLPYAQHFDVDPPSDQRLVARLRAILAQEYLASNVSSLLNHLVVGSAGDIRSCLYTLQFAAAKARAKGTKKGGVVDLSDTLKGALRGDGLKDARTDLASTVAVVFKKPKKQRDSNEVAASTHKVLSVVESFGENSKTLDCLFSNLLQVSYVDPTMERCVLAHEWLSGGGYMSSAATAGAIHVLCRIETRANLTLSNRESSDAHYQREANRGILQKFVEGLQHSSYNNAITETVPYALWMLSASNSLYRPVSSIDVLNKKEMVAFDAHVSTLRSLGLTYVAGERTSINFAQKEMTTTIEMRLEPEIHRLVYYRGYKAAPQNWRKKVPSALRELLAHKAHVATIRDREVSATSTSKSQSAKSKFAPQPPVIAKPVTTAPNLDEAPVIAKPVTAAPNKGEAPVIAKPVTAAANKDETEKQKITEAGGDGPPLKKVRTAAPKNFLGIGAQKAKAARTARQKALVGFSSSRCRLEKLSNTGSGLPLKQVIRFKYQKGFTQAVRTPCRIDELM